MTEQFASLSRALADRYRLETPLGEGGMATVYLAYDLRHARQVALKVLKPELAEALGAQRFLKEIQVTANLQHPHILPLYDSGDAGGALFYVMPLVRGESLREYLERAYDADSQLLAWLGQDAMFDSLRSEPRFIALMRKLHFVK